MKVAGLLCVATYCMVATAVAIRMLRLGGRTGQLPELTIGTSMFAGGAIGYPLWVAFGVLAAQHPELALRAGFAGTLGLHLSGWANLLAWHAIYQREQRGSLGVVAVTTALLFVSLIDRLASVDATVHGAHAAGGLAAYRVSLVCQAFPYVLMAASSLRYHALLKRRLALGLADPVVANRIWLWGTVSALVVVQYGWSLATLHLRHLPVVVAASHLVVAGLGLALAALLSLAFFPPQAYLRRVAAAGAANGTSQP